jgi:uroporphyrinogen-III synthase
VLADAPLHGIGILVTRPLEQAAGLVNELRQLGAHPVLFPALAILPPRDPGALQDVISRLDTFHLAIFISPTAAQRGLAAINATGAWPLHLAVAAVGKGTAKALGPWGITSLLEPEDGADSEHLLALPRLQDMAGKRVVIFRGEGGREVLAHALRDRGASVTYAECYRRGLPEQADPLPVLTLFETGGLQAVTAYSSETLDNLFLLLGASGRDHLRHTPLFVPHPRIAEHARTLGVQTVIASPSGDAQLAACLVEYFTHE